MAKLYGEIAKNALLTLDKSFSRALGQPLDASEVYYSLEAAQTYAATPAAYIGQKIVVIEDGVVTHYSVEDTNGTLKELGVRPSGDGKSIEVSADGVISILGVAGADSLTLPRMKEDKSGIEWVSVSQVVEGDGNDNTTYTFTELTKGEGEAAEVYGFVVKTFFNGAEVEGGSIEIAFDVYTKSETDAAIKVETDRAVSAEGALEDRIEALEGNKADISYVDDEIAGLEDAISKLNHFTTKIVESTDAVTETGILYLIKDTTVTGVDKYNEYLYIEGQGAVLIGDTTTDLSDYYNKETVDNKVATAEQNAKDYVDALTEIGDESATVSATGEAVNISAGMSVAISSRGALSINCNNQSRIDFAGDGSDITVTGDMQVQTPINDTSVANKAYVDQKADKTALETLETSLYNGSYTKGEETITSNIIEADREASRLITPDEMAKLAALVLDEDGSVGVSGTISAENVTGLETKVVSVVTGAISEGTNALGIEKGAQVNKIEKVVFNGVEATIENKVATIAGEYYTKSETDAKVKTVSDTLVEVQSTANTAKANAEANTTEINTVKGIVDGHTTSIGKNASDIAALVTKVAIEEGKVGTLETAVAGKADSSTVTALSGQVGTIEGNLTALTGKVSANETAITNLANDKANKTEVYTKTEIDAKTGTVPTDKTIIDLISDAKSEAITAASYNDTEVRELISGNTNKLTTLIGSDADKSVRTIAAEEVNTLIGGANDADTITNVTTLIEYVNANGAEVIAMKKDIANNAEDIQDIQSIIAGLGGENQPATVLEAITAATPTIATAEVAGLVLASTAENAINVNATGVMTVNSLNVNKLVQTEGEELILNGGSATL